MNKIVNIFKRNDLARYSKLNRIMTKSELLFNKKYPLDELLNKIEGLA